jgi:CheY-like chemotaxis protein
VSPSDLTKSRRVLIASSHSLFGQGLRSLLRERKEAGVEIVGMVSNLDEALLALDQLNPDLIIVDYDDKKLNRDEFLARFVEGEKKLRVVLLSLQSAQEAIIYDRRTMAAHQIDDWLEEWTYTDESSKITQRECRTGCCYEEKPYEKSPEKSGPLIDCQPPGRRGNCVADLWHAIRPHLARGSQRPGPADRSAVLP